MESLRIMRGSNVLIYRPAQLFGSSRRVEVESATCRKRVPSVQAGMSGITKSYVHTRAVKEGVMEPH